MDKKIYLFVFISGLLASLVFLTGYSKENIPSELYHVYLEGKSIGYIESKSQLEKFINDEEIEIKEKFKVDTVYTPNNLDVIKETVYNPKISTINDIYNEIKEMSPFAVEGYSIKIKGVEKKGKDENYISDDIIINVIDRTVFEKAIKNTIFVFVPEEDYNGFVNKQQKELVDTGKKIEDIYIKNEITIKKAKISVNDNIYVNEELLSKYLLFGTLDSQKQYTIKNGDTIEQVSYNNKLSVEEFLIANTEFTSADNLLFPGQVVTLGIIKPAFDVVEEDHVVEVENSKYKTEVIYDDTVVSGFEHVKQEGKNGTNRVTKKIQKVNGEIVSAAVVKSEEVVPAINRIVVRGNGTISIGSVGTWGWPTATPYVITSGYQWRWGTFHDGIDITATGYGSPIYSINDGVVETSSFTSHNGYYIVINHNNGYYSIYAHLSKLLVKQGDIVTIGQQIGKMGSSGYATGTHLHFGIWRGFPYYGGVSLNPMAFY